MSWKLKSVTRSPKPEKKWVAKFQDENGKEKHTHFGAAGMDDFTLTKDEVQRERYRTRHAKDLDTGDYTRAGFLSYYILWNKPTITASVADFRKRFG
jgi:phage terminase large subunit